MRRDLLFLLSAMLLLVSCGQSKEAKIERLVKESIQSTLYIPDSYEAVKTQVDSAFTPFGDPIFKRHLWIICL